MKNKAASTDKDTADAMKVKNGLITDAISGVMQAPDDQLPQQIQSAAQELASKGLFDPEHVQQAMQVARTAQTNPAQARQQLNVMATSLGAYSKMLEDTHKAQDIAKGQLTPGQIAQLNQGFTQRFQVLNPGKPIPSAFQLPLNATPDDFTRVDKVLQGTEQAQGTLAQQQVANGLRQQMFQLAQQNAQNAQATRQEGMDAKNRKWVTGTDSTGKQIAGPVSELQQLGAQNLAELPTQEVRDVQNARHAVNLMEKQGDTSKPETMGTLQLIDALDKEGKLGVLASRYNKFVTSGVGASPGDDPRIVTLLNKNMLQDTAVMLSHFGASGGRSPQMLQHFIDLSNAGKMDGVTLRAGTKAIADYMHDRAMMPSQQPTNQQQPQGGNTPQAQQSGQPMTITLPSGKKVTIQ
jgi:hypothetical protein